MKILKNLLRKIIYSSFLLYGCNLILVNFSMMIPINIYSVCIISLLGSYGLIVLVLFKYLIL